MSNPSGPESGADYGPDDPITEVIDIPVEMLANPPLANPLADPPLADSSTGARRYTAPGFDAGSTQIINRVPDPPTEYLMRLRSEPQAIPARGGRRRLWRLLAGLLVAGVVAAAVAGALVFKRNSDRAAQERSVRSTIEKFDNAVQHGDLATLRSITCGQTRDNYVKYDDRMWTDAYSKVIAAKQYPVVAGIDDVVVNGTHAEANVTSYMAFDPGTTSTRSFDLQFQDDQWKICQAP